MSEILLYHGSKEEVVYPEIRITRYTKDFLGDSTARTTISKPTAGQTAVLPMAL